MMKLYLLALALHVSSVVGEKLAQAQRVLDPNKIGDPLTIGLIFIGPIVGFTAGFLLYLFYIKFTRLRSVVQQEGQRKLLEKLIEDDIELQKKVKDERVKAENKRVQEKKIEAEKQRKIEEKKKKDELAAQKKMEEDNKKEEIKRKKDEAR